MTCAILFPVYGPEMRRDTFEPCIFCRENAASSRSEEHIISESLGNTEHVLPSGVVCDRCNNYFARKIEGPLLSSEYFRHARAAMQVVNKRGRVPPRLGFLPHLKMRADVWLDETSITVEPHDRNRAGDFERSLLQGAGGSLWFPEPNFIDKKLMSRLLGKVAIEALAVRLMKITGWREEISRQEPLDLLRRYVRIGDKPELWCFTRRRLYPRDQRFESSSGFYEVLHEFDFLYTPHGNLIFVLAIFGEEFAIDMGNPNSEIYAEYLESKGGQSLLAPWN